MKTSSEDIRRPRAGLLSGRLLLVIALCTSAFLAVQTLVVADRTSGSPGFPLDDAWIHLQFARNLHDFGTFSYFRNEMITAGSTSPLFTALLAVGFFMTSNGVIVSYILGITAFLAAGVVMYRVAGEIFEGSSIAAVGSAALLLLEPRLQWIAMSGMETTLFILLFLAAYFALLRRLPVLLGATCGLMLWTRPDAIIAVAAIAGTILYERVVVRRTSTKKKRHQDATLEDLRWLKKAVGVFLVFAAAYAAFNLVLSGSLLPNTFAAKVKYYAGAKGSFPAETFHFLADGHMVVPVILATISVAGSVWWIGKRKRVRLLFPLLWSVGLFVSYWIDLPRLYQHGRYLMPMLPAVLLMSVDGARTLVELAAQWIRSFRQGGVSHVVEGMILAAIALQFGWTDVASETAYAEDCRYIGDRQVRTALWIRDHLPKDAIIATHDIGAIAYYSERRVVDMVGLVSPEMINNIGRFDLLTQFLERSKVRYVAALKNWFEIANENPVFETDPLHPEVMEVYPFDPKRMHFTPQDATRLNDAGEYYLSSGNAAAAMQLLKRSYTLDPRSARTNFLLGVTLRTLNDTASSRQMFRNARLLQPDYPGLPAQ